MVHTLTWDPDGVTVAHQVVTPQYLIKTLIIHLHYFDSSDLNLAYSIRAYWVNIIIIDRGVSLSKTIVLANE